ncbi:MAG: glycoside hydrolase family 2 TIM barrel-domain containing protein [Nonlabens sp.]
MKQLLVFLSFFVATHVIAQTQNVSVASDINGMVLTVDGKPFMINGMNWDYVPIGTNYSYSLWNQTDEFIKSALDAEMGLLRNMNVNTIRVYTGMQPKWIQYIYENFGIHTMLNDSFGRYGLTIDGVWMPNTEYADPRVKEQLMTTARDMANQYKDTPGLLLYMLGNENNYGLSWGGAETEDIPIDSESSTIRKRARAMYKLFNEATLAIKAIDPTHPIAICNGDLLYLDLVKEECPDIDIYGTNMYRGVSFGDAFARVKNEINKPILFAEFGADAYNAREMQEDQYSQAYYMTGNWKEIYANAAGLGMANNSLGGFTFQFSDGWWKRGQTENLSTHDTEASWSNGGYARDAEPGKNNMNEEWFGICAKGPSNAKGLYTLYPRAAYYALKEVHDIDVYGADKDLISLESKFKEVELMDAVLRARGDKAALDAQGGSKLLGISQLRAELSTFTTGGSLITTPENPEADGNIFPNQLGFDHMQSYFIGVEGNPASNVRAEVVLNVVGNVAQNPINEIFYENRSRPLNVNSDDGDVILGDVNRVNLYQGEFEWNSEEFDLKGFYRTGHYHWQYEGDFFGFYPEANYGPNLDIYGGEILGFEVDGKKGLEGLKAAFGPQLWWGANPTALIKYQRQVGKFSIAGIYHRDIETDLEFDDNGRRVLDQNQLRSGVIPPWPTERASLAIERSVGKFDITLGGIWAGSPLNGSVYQDINDAGIVVNDRINSGDNWGGKAKIAYNGGKFNWYAQGAMMGLIANAGADVTQTFTGWRLRDSGSGNQTNFLTGFTYSVDDFQIAPNFMWRKPLVAAMPNNVGAPGRLRNIIDDPFSVREGNREATAGELLLTYDPTPGTWMYAWDNDRTEDAGFAMNLGFVYQHLPTTMDAHIGFNANRTFFAFPESVPAEDLWEVHTRIVAKPTKQSGIIGNFYYGNGQANGDSKRLLRRFGGDVRAIYNNLKLQTHVKVNDWGPYDYHRDFNLTFPVQLMLDLSTTLGKPDWFILPTTVVGIRGTWRSLDQFSPRYAPNAPAAEFQDPRLAPVGFPDGSEWEIKTYLNINIGK